MEFRTMFDTKKYSDDEYFEPGTSITEQGQVQSIQQILARCVRGESLPFSGDYYYENEKAETLDEAFANEDPTQVDGFDLVDTGPILADIAQAMSGPAVNSQSNEAQQSEANEAANSSDGPSQSAS